MFPITGTNELFLNSIHYSQIDGKEIPAEAYFQFQAHNRNVIDIYEVIDIDDFFVYVMERPENCQDLFQIIEDRYKANSALTEKEARKYFSQVLNANICCEENGVLHRDVKPENILIDMSCDEAKLIDFGLSSEIQEKPFTRFRGEKEIISLKVPTLSSQSISFVVICRTHHLRSEAKPRF